MTSTNKWYLAVVQEDDHEIQVGAIFNGSRSSFFSRSSIQSLADKLINLTKSRGGLYDVYIYPAHGGDPLIFKPDARVMIFHSRFWHNIRFKKNHVFKIVAVAVGGVDVRMPEDK